MRFGSVWAAAAVFTAFVCVVGCTGATDNTATTSTSTFRLETSTTTQTPPTISTTPRRVAGSKCDTVGVPASVAIGQVATAQVVDATDQWLVLDIEIVDGIGDPLILSNGYAEAWCNVDGKPEQVWRSYSDHSTAATTQLAEERPVIIPVDIGYVTDLFLIGLPGELAPRQYELRFSFSVEDPGADLPVIEELTLIWDSSS